MSDSVTPYRKPNQYIWNESKMRKILSAGEVQPRRKLYPQLLFKITKIWHQQLNSQLFVYLS